MQNGPRPHGGPPDPQGRVARILVVDDERSILTLVRTLLEPHDIECIALDDPVDAVSLLGREPVDILICDAHLRGAPADDPVAEARRIDPATAIILTTSHRPIGRESRTASDGIYDCLKKPFEMGRLPTIVSHALERRRLLREKEELRNVLAMHRICYAVDAYLDDQKGYDVFLKSARMAVSADRAGLYAGQPGGPHVLELGTGLSPDDQRSDLARTVARRVIDTGASLKFPDAHGNGVGLPNGVHSVAAVAVRDETGDVAGALVAMRESSPWMLNGEHLRVLEGLSQEAARLMRRSGAIPSGERRHEEPPTDMLHRLVSQLDRLEHEPAGHSQRIAEFALRLAVEIGLPAWERGSLRTAALLHDVGKVGVRAAVLLKAGPLTESERHEVERHVEVGNAILEGLGLQESVVRIVHAHHERFNGSGYPDGLTGEDIPVGARILAIADTLEAMTFPRPYREALGYDGVVEEISRRSAARFDPDLVRAFLAIPRGEWEAIRDRVASAAERIAERQTPEVESGDAIEAPREEQAL
ncbi:MAG: HD domain-containing phosphohydrolase [Gemmatimonadota bacterium]